MTKKHFISKAAGKLAGSPMFKVLARAQELERAGKKVYHFEIGDPDFDTPENIRRAAISSLERGETHYVNSMGIAELREAIREETKNSLGFMPDLEQVIVTPAISVIYFVTRCVCDPGDEVIVPDPGFSSYYSAFDFIGVKWVGVPLREENEFRMSPADVRERITDKTRLIIVNSPSNPTGSVNTKEEMEELAKIAREHDIYLLSDEAYSKMVYEGEFHSPTIYDQCREYSIILNSFSKTYAMTGFRLGWTVVPHHLSEKIGLMVQTVISAVPEFIQRAGIAALEGDQSFVKESLAEYNNRREITVGMLNEMPGVSCVKSAGAFYAFPNITGTGMTSEQFAEFALERAGVVLLPGSAFGQHGEGYVRLVYATSLEDIKQGLGKLKQALESR